MPFARRFAHGISTLDHGVIALILFLLSAALVGGSSRFDAVSNVMVGAIMTIYLLYLCLFGRPSWDRRFAVPLIVVSLCIVIMAVQLVPLPPKLWAMLPGRADFLPPWLTELQTWHPLAFNFPRAASSMVPVWMALVMLVGIMALPAERRPVLSGVWLLVALLCAGLGILQVVGGEASPFYFYQRTNRGYLTGLFANRNHSAAFLAAMLPLIRAWLLGASSDYDRRSRRLLAAAMLVLFTACILLTGSRAGLLLLGVGMVGYYAVRPVKIAAFGAKGRDRLKPIFIAFALAGMVGAFIANDRVNGYDRLLSFDSSAELRFIFLPQLRAMAMAFFPVGSGFGSFDSLFRIVEPWTELRPTYFNNAHNDFIEILIAAGAIVIVPITLAIAWVIRWSWRAFRTPACDVTTLTQRAACFGILILMLASWVDYPLRTPTIALFYVFLFSTGAWAHDDIVVEADRRVARI